MECGYLRKAEAGAKAKFVGEINLGKRLNGDVSLYENPRAKREGASDETPDYIVTYRGRNIGSAWIKSGKTTTEFLSVTMDDPDWSSALNFAAFPDGSDGFRVVWSRPRRAGALDNASAAM